MTTAACHTQPRWWSPTTHRSTVQPADRVALLADGRIAAIGTHSDLLAGNTEYRRLLSTLDDDVRDEVVA